MNNKQSTDLLKEKQQQLIKKQVEEKRLAKELGRLESEFEEVQQLADTIKPRKIKQMIRATGAYVLGRRNRKQLYSQTYKKKQASNDLKPYLIALYNEGFIKESLADLQQIYITTNNSYLRQAIAWELALWFANKLTENSAFRAIPM